MLPTPKTSRFVPFLLTALALFFIVREPAHAAQFATNAFTGLMTVTESLMTFASNLG
ncbi:hypothetical protein [Streptosporangium lutulentum]|uniref:Uncharacterized protein n=1 Tax=Streptosporangium lutulentum TaxID=1461250 RepID=A0ABT9QMK4_9ACTN|nr:hypothetical protein [Streptosporangium lutulentum]MDP9847992.1 hypothetical protein [Streptosporangium lutulentum]